ncbi:MATE family efflux transporter [Flexistipes sinusarabici]|nr:MATE family efflux transporter [Flexistipes sinusarabici]
MILIMVFMFFISLTDVFIAGRISKDVQASVGLVSQVYFIFVVVATSSNVGTVSVISRLYSSDDRETYKNAVYSILLTIFIAGIVLSVLGVLLSPFIIKLLNVPESIKKISIPLTQIYAAGVAFQYVLLCTNGILRASKMVKRSLLTMSVVCVINIFLNFYFVFYTPIYYNGIALSTAVSLFIGAVINFFFVKKILKGALSYTFYYVKRIFNIGWPSALLQLGWQLGTTTLFLIIAKLPEKSVEVMAALTNGMRIESAIFLPAFAFNMANAVIVGNLLGEGKKHEAFKNGIVTAVMGVIAITLMTLIVVIFAKDVSQILSKNSLVIDESVLYIYISMISEPFMAFSVILGGGLNGAGDTRSVMVRIVAGMWLVRIPLAYIMGISLGFGAPGIWWSMNASIITQMILITRRYFKKEWLDYAV